MNSGSASKSSSASKSKNIRGLPSCVLLSYFAEWRSGVTGAFYFTFPSQCLAQGIRFQALSFDLSCYLVVLVTAMRMLSALFMIGAELLSLPSQCLGAGHCFHVSFIFSFL
jgi:hypothetical protein